jgi:hypothetical protein
MSEEIEMKHKKNREIFEQMQGAMRDGLSYKAYFELVKKMYAGVYNEELANKRQLSKKSNEKLLENKLSMLGANYKDEWKKHHQGGPTGYACREFTITPTTEGVIRSNQAYAWNPSITGAKCEDTTYLHEDGTVEVLTKCVYI